MKKTTFLFALALMLLCSTATKAINWTVGPRVTTLTPEKHYVIYNSCHDDGYGKFFLYQGDGTDIFFEWAATPAAFTNLERKHVWKLEEGTVAGTYSLKNLETGKYPSAYGNFAGTKQNLEIADAATYAGARGGDVMNEDGSNAGNANDYKTPDIFFIRGYGMEDANWTSNPGNGGFNSLSDGAQAHAFYEVPEEVVAELLSTEERDKLIAMIAELNALVAALEGELPGQVSSSRLVDIKAAIATAQGVVDDNGSEDDCAAAYTTLVEAYLLFGQTATFNPFKSGTAYKIVSAYRDFTNANKVKAIYLDGTTPKWGTFDAANPFFYWTVKEAEGGDYTLQNTLTGEYLANHESMSTTAVTADLNGYNGAWGQYKIVVGGSSLHANNSNTAEGDNFISYSGSSSSPSSWMFVEATPEELAAVTEYGAAVLAEAKNLHAKVGVGYPNGTERSRLDAAIQLPPATEGYAKILEQAIAAYKTTSAVQLPESGKAYAISAIFPDGSSRAMCWDGNRMSTSASETAIPFVCRVTADGKFVLVDNNGSYLSWFSDEKGYKPNVGVTGQYEVVDGKAYNDLTITRASVEKTSGSIQDGTTNEDFFGRVHIQGVNTDGETFYLAARSDGDFIAGGALDKWYDWDGWSSQWRSVTFAIEEIEDFRNTITFNELGGGQPKVATYSAPYPTVIPENARAYAITGSKTAEGEEVATTEELEGSVIPANTGVLLASDNLTSVAMAPAADEGVGVAPKGNLLRATGGTNAEVMLGADETAFILANPAAGLGFYPLSNNVVASYRAYLVLDGAVNAVKLIFGGPATGIEAVEEVETDDASVYDLSGRKVLAPTKGGIYVKNGKKYIVK